MAVLTPEREHLIRIGLATTALTIGALLTFLRVQQAFAFLPDVLQNAVWAGLGGTLQLIIAAALWVKRFRTQAAIAFIAICSIQACLLYYHLLTVGAPALKGPVIIILVLVHLVLIKAGVKIVRHGSTEADAVQSA